MTERHDIWQLADHIQMDLRAAQAKLIELRSQLAALNLPNTTTLECQCGLKFKGPRRLAEHIHTSHDGPIPEHWQAIEAASLEPADEWLAEAVDSSRTRAQTHVSEQAG